MAFPSPRYWEAGFRAEFEPWMKSQFSQSKVGVQKLSCHPASITSFAESFMTLNWKQEHTLGGKKNFIERETKWDWCSVRVNKIQSIIICFRLIFDWITSHKSAFPPISHSDRGKEADKNKEQSRLHYVFVSVPQGHNVWTHTRDTHTSSKRENEVCFDRQHKYTLNEWQYCSSNCVRLCEQIEIDEMLHEQGHGGIYGVRTHTHTWANFTDT